MEKAKKGIFYMILSTICFTTLGVVVKKMSKFPIAEIHLFSSLISLIISYILLKKQQIAILGKAKKLLVLRGITAGLGMFLFFITLVRLPLSAANILQNTSLIFTNILGIYLLHEKVHLRNWLFFGIAFLGVFLVYAPHLFTVSGKDTKKLNICLGLLSALLMGLANNLNAKIGQRENPLVIFNYALYCTILFAGINCFNNFILPNWQEAIWFIMMGIISFIANYYAIFAYQYAPIRKVTAISYLSIPLYLIVDIVWLGNHFTYITLCGILLISLGVLLNLHFD